MNPVYLAGAITHADGHGRAWRSDATRLLSSLPVINPLDLELDAGSPKDVVATDLAAIDECLCVLVDVRAPSWGTAMELWHAHSLGKHVVAWGKEPTHWGREPGGGWRSSPWLRYVTDEFHLNLGPACAAIMERYLALR